MNETAFDQAEPQLKNLDKHDVRLRGLTTILVVVLGFTVVGLYLPQAWGSSISWLPAPETRSTLAVGILGLAILFYLYVIQRLKDLTRVRKELLSTRLREELMRGRFSELSSLFETMARATLHLDLDRMLDIIVRRVLICLEADQSSILILDEASGELRCRAVTGRDEEFVRDARIKLGEGIAGWVAEHNSPLVLDDVEIASRFPDQLKRGRDIASALCVPLSSGDHVVGVLNINRLEQRRPFTAMDSRLTMIFSEHIASAVLRIREFSALDQKTSSLEESNQQLSKLNRMKEVFLATARHELRTPLAAILASSELLKRDGLEIDPDRHEKLVNTIFEQANHLRSLIHGIKDLSSIEEGTLKLDRGMHSINQIAAEAIRAIEGQAARRGIRLLADFDEEMPVIPLDGLKIRQVILNLLTNATKFSSTGESIRIVTRVDDNRAILEVADHGMGIRAEDIDQVFHLFARSEEAIGHSIEGLGLGLYLVKRYVEVHDGSVWVESSPGKGSRFFIAIPIPNVDPSEEDHSPETGETDTRIPFERAA